MMKKYFGKKEWSETLYLSDVFDESTIKKNGEIEIDEEKVKHEYCIGMRFDWDKIMGFRDYNVFEDTNEFITYSEIFNVYQDGKI